MLIPRQHIAKQANGIDWSFMSQCVNVILLRNPMDILTSVMQACMPCTHLIGLQWSEKLPCTLEATSMVDMVRIWDHLTALGKPPIVIDADRLAKEPRVRTGHT